MLGRHRHLPADRQGLLRQGKAQWCALDRPRAGSQIPRAARCARNPRRRQSHGDKTCTRSAFAKSGDLDPPRRIRLEERFGKWGLALAGKSRGEDAGGWFDTEVGADSDAKSISHEHTYNEDTADPEPIESTLMRFPRWWAAACAKPDFYARTMQLKLRYKDFTTITRAPLLPSATQLDTEIFEQIRRLFRKNWKTGIQVRLLGVHVSGFEAAAGQGNLLEDDRRQRWQKALSAADRLRDKFGEQSVHLAGGMEGSFRERTHESLPERKPKN